MLSAVRLVLAGGVYVPPMMLTALPPGIVAGVAPAQNGDARSAGASSQTLEHLRSVLTERQVEVLQLLSQGKPNKLIGRSLGISEGTVKIHLASIFQQLGAPNRAAAVAIYNGWLTPQLQVLRPECEGARKPALGQAGPIPLRAGGGYKYPLLANEEPHGLPMAAEPEVPFRKTISRTG